MIRMGFATLALALATPGFATTFIDGTVDGIATVKAGGETSTSSTGPASTAVPGTINASGFGFLSLPDGSDAYAVVEVAGTWASADAGSIAIDWGWQLRTSASPEPSSAETNGAGANWAYTFTASGDGVFAGRYNVRAEDNPFGLQPIFGTLDMPFGPYGGDVFDPTGSGSFSVPLLSGQTYTMAFFNNGNVFFETAGGDITGFAFARIDWTISYAAIPEPASWAMLIAGFGLVGAAARRRREASLPA